MPSHYFLHLKIHFFKISFLCEFFFHKYHYGLLKPKIQRNVKKIFFQCEIDKSQARREDDDSSKEGIQPWYLEPNLFKSHTLYHQIYQASLKKFFNQISVGPFQD